MPEQELDALVDWFEQQWQAGDQPDLTALLGEAPPSHQILVDLVNIDLEFRLKSGQSIQVESYVERFPRLNSDRDAFLSLVEAEYLLRRRRIPELLIDEYCRRFPEFSDTLRDRHGTAERGRAFDATLPASDTRDNDSVHEHNRNRADHPAGVQAKPLLGDYELLEEVGRGGMGIVYKARQLSLNRTVAVKTMTAGVLASTQQVARFRREAESAGKLRHPHIVSVYEYGSDSGRHFLAMEYIQGQSLAAAVRETPWSGRRAAELVAKVARAIQYSHDQGVLHRDIKPSNVIIDHDGEPHVMDFGLAKAIDETDDRDNADGVVPGEIAALTATGQLMGTPAFMPPEQTGGLPCSPAGDVYSLGATLYTTLTGRPPFLAATNIETMMLARNENCLPLRRLNSRIDRDLETICLKCLAKEPSRRYQSAADLADDLQHYLDGQPIAARPVGMVERLVRWRKRNPRVAAWSMSTYAALLVIAVGSSVAAVVIEKQKRQAKEQTARSLMQTGLMDCQENRLRQGIVRFSQAVNEAAHHVELRRAARNLSTHWSAELVPTWVHDSEVHNVAFSSDSSHLAAVCQDGSIYLWDVPEGKNPRVWQGHARSGNEVVFNEGGTLFATSSSDGTIRVWNADDGRAIGQALKHEGGRIEFLDDKALITAGADGSVNIWRIDGETIVMDGLPLSHPSRIRNMALDRDLQMLLVGYEDGSLLVWNLATRKRIRELKAGADRKAHANQVVRVALSPDGQWALSAGADSKVLLWRLDAENVTREFTVGNPNTRGLEFSADSKTFLIAGRDHVLRVYEIQDQPDSNGDEPATTIDLRYEYSHRDAIKYACFNADGTLVVTTSEDYTARVHDIELKQPRGKPIRHEYYVRQAAFSPDGQYVATAGWDKLVCLRTLTSKTPEVQLHHADQVWAVAERPGERAASRVVTAGRDGVARLWNSAGEEVAQLKFNDWVVCAAFGPAGDVFAAGSYDGTVQIADANTGKLLRTLYHRPERTAGPVVDRALHAQVDASAAFVLAFSHDGQTLATMAADGTTRLWDTASGSLRGDRSLMFPVGVPQVAVNALTLNAQTYCVLRFTRDDSRLLASHLQRGVHLWDLSKTDAPALRLGGINGPDRLPWETAILSPDERYVVISQGDDRRQLRFWRTDTGQEFGAPIVLELAAAAHELAFSPDGARLAGAMTNGRVKLWDVETRSLAVDPMIHSTHTHVRCVRFSPEGRVLASAGLDGTARLWDATTGHWLGIEYQHGGAVVDMSFSADGLRLLTASADGTARVWDLPRRPSLKSRHITPWIESITGMTWDDLHGRVRAMRFAEWQTARAKLVP